MAGPRTAGRWRVIGGGGDGGGDDGSSGGGGGCRRHFSTITRGPGANGAKNRAT